MDYYVYEVTSYDQAKVLSNKSRDKIIQLFGDYTPRTSKQIADQLKINPATAHYHVRELLRVGLLKLVETKEYRGVLEKYYLPIAKQLVIKLGKQNPETPVEESPRAVMSKYKFNERRDAYIHALKKAKMDDSASTSNPAYMLSSFNLHLSLEEQHELRSELLDLLFKWDQRTNPTGEKPATCTVFVTMNPEE